MMELPSYFEKFLKEIRLTDNQRNDCITGHKCLRDRLNGYDDLKSYIVTTFLQGSYRRSTIIRPKGESKSDVDVVVVTRLDKEKYPDPDKAMDLFIPFLDKYYEKKYERQGRSFGINLSYVKLDLVITSAPSEVVEELLKSAAVTTFETIEEAKNWRLTKSWNPNLTRESLDFIKMAEEKEWKTEPLWIPDRKAKKWEPTNPLEQIKWTVGKNARCSGHYVNVVKAIKWWQRLHFENDRPKGYPLEHLIGVCCPEYRKYVAQCITETFENIVQNYSYNYQNKIVPELYDHGVDQNVFARITPDEFSIFYEHVVEASKIARQALNANNPKESTENWRLLFGAKFPPSDDDNKSNDLDPKGPFVAASVKSQTGDLTPRRYGQYE